MQENRERQEGSGWEGKKQGIQEKGEGRKEM